MRKLAISLFFVSWFSLGIYAQTLTTGSAYPITILTCKNEVVSFPDGDRLFNGLLVQAGNREYYLDIPITAKVVNQVVYLSDMDRYSDDVAVYLARVSHPTMQALIDSIAYCNANVQSLTLSGDTLRISGGNFVLLDSLTGGGGADSLKNLLDVSTTPASERLVLYYNPETNLWEDRKNVKKYGASYGNSLSLSKEGTADIGYSILYNLLSFNTFTWLWETAIPDTTLLSGINRTNIPARSINETNPSDGLGFDNVVRHGSVLYWMSYFEALYNPDVDMHLAAIGEGGVTSDSLVNEYYIDSLKAQLNVMKTKGLDKLDFFVWGVGPQETPREFAANTKKLWQVLEDTLGVVDNRTLFLIQGTVNNPEINGTMQGLCYGRPNWKYIPGMMSLPTVDGIHFTAQAVKDAGLAAWQLWKSGIDSNQDTLLNFSVGPPFVTLAGAMHNISIFANYIDDDVTSYTENFLAVLGSYVELTNDVNRNIVLGANIGQGDTLNLNDNSYVLAIGQELYYDEISVRDSSLMIGWNSTSSKGNVISVGFNNVIDKNLSMIFGSNQNTTRNFQLMLGDPATQYVMLGGLEIQLPFGMGAGEEDYVLAWNNVCGCLTFEPQSGSGGSGILSLILSGDSGPNQILSDGNTIEITGGTGIETAAQTTDSLVITLSNTAVTPGNYGSSTQISQITVDAQGRLTSAGTVPVNIPTSQITNFATSVQAQIGSNLLASEVPFWNGSALDGSGIRWNSSGNNSLKIVAPTDTVAFQNAGPVLFSNTDNVEFRDYGDGSHEATSTNLARLLGVTASGVLVDVDLPGTELSQAVNAGGLDRVLLYDNSASQYRYITIDSLLFEFSTIQSVNYWSKTGNNLFYNSGQVMINEFGGTTIDATTVFEVISDTVGTDKAFRIMDPDNDSDGFVRIQGAPNGTAVQIDDGSLVFGGGRLLMNDYSRGNQSLSYFENESTTGWAVSAEAYRGSVLTTKLTGTGDYPNGPALSIGTVTGFSNYTISSIIPVLEIGAYSNNQLAAHGKIGAGGGLAQQDRYRMKFSSSADTVVFQRVTVAVDSVNVEERFYTLQGDALTLTMTMEEDGGFTFHQIQNGNHLQDVTSISDKIAWVDGSGKLKLVRLDSLGSALVSLGLVDGTPGGSGDNLGDHTMTEDLNTNGFDITNVGSLNIDVSSVLTLDGATSVTMQAGSPSNRVTSSSTGLGRVEASVVQNIESGGSIYCYIDSDNNQTVNVFEIGANAAGNGDGTYIELFSITEGGVVKINDTYTMPTDAGTNNYVLTTDGAGGTSWQSVSGSGDNLGNHTAEQDLDFNEFGAFDLDTLKFFDANSDAEVYQWLENVASGDLYLYRNAVEVLSIEDATLALAMNYHQIKQSGQLTFQNNGADTEYSLSKNIFDQLEFRHEGTLRFVFGDDGELILSDYGTGSSYTGTVDAYLAVTSSGNVIRTTLAGGADNLGNHIATASLNLDGNEIDSVSIFNLFDTDADGVYWSIFEDGSGNIVIQDSGAGTDDFKINEGGTIFIGNGPTLDNTNTRVLSRDLTTGAIEEIEVSFISGGGGGSAANYRFIAKDTSTGTITGDTWTDLTWETEILENLSFTHAANSAEITFDSTGSYLISALIQYTMGTERTDSWAKIVKDTGGGYTDEAFVGKYFSFETAPPTQRAGYAIAEYPYEATAGDKIKIQVYVNNVSDWAHANSSISIERVE